MQIASSQKAGIIGTVIGLIFGIAGLVLGIYFGVMR